MTPRRGTVTWHCWTLKSHLTSDESLLNMQTKCWASCIAPVRNWRHVSFSTFSRWGNEWSIVVIWAGAAQIALLNLGRVRKRIRVLVDEDLFPPSNNTFNDGMWQASSCTIATFTESARMNYISCSSTETLTARTHYATYVAANHPHFSVFHISLL